MSNKRLRLAAALAAFGALLPLAATSALGATPKTNLTMDQAKSVALAKESGTIKSGELEHEHGRWIYSFDVQHQNQVREVNVDANTGKVVEDSLDTPADEAKEAAAENVKTH